MNTQVAPSVERIYKMQCTESALVISERGEIRRMTTVVCRRAGADLAKHSVANDTHTVHLA